MAHNAGRPAGVQLWPQFFIETADFLSEYIWLPWSPEGVLLLTFIMSGGSQIKPL